ncbi:MAG TPA: glycosyltransferase [Actinomycetota bacterium]|nr:glycosyltransferase [Actinomycetota bacterium]
MPDVPEDVTRLAEERAAARAAKDFAAADAIRERIAAAGWSVIDEPDGFRLEPHESEPAQPIERRRADDVGSVLEDGPDVDVTVHWVCEGWPEDIERALLAFRANEAGRSVQYVIADVTERDPSAWGDGVEVVWLEEGTGWGAARNAGLKRTRGRTALLVDGSVEPTGDVFGPLEFALDDPAVGVCGPFGIVTRDLREFHEAKDGDVDAIESYLMALRRETLLDAGLFDEKFRWYRSADVEYSFRIKDLDRRAIVVDVPVEKHEHRMWFETPPEQRERWSKKNFYRFLDRFRDRWDLLVDPLPEDERPHRQDHEHDD